VNKQLYVEQVDYKAIEEAKKWNKALGGDVVEEHDCVAGCQRYTGGEVRHHKDCPHYANSFSQMYDHIYDNAYKKGFEDAREMAITLAADTDNLMTVSKLDMDLIDALEQMQSERG